MPGGVPNPASAFLGTTAKPSLGPTYSYLVDATLWLAKAKQVLDTDREDLYIAEIFKSRKTVLFSTFTMSQVGITDTALYSMQAAGWCFLEFISGVFKNAGSDSVVGTVSARPVLFS